MCETTDQSGNINSDTVQINLLQGDSGSEYYCPEDSSSNIWEGTNELDLEGKNELTDKELWADTEGYTHPSVNADQFLKARLTAQGCVLLKDIDVCYEEDFNGECNEWTTISASGMVLCKGSLFERYGYEEYQLLPIETEEKKIIKFRVSVKNKLKNEDEPEHNTDWDNGERLQLQWIPDADKDFDDDGFDVLSDCDDSNPLIYPGAQEACDGRQNNCNWKTSAREECECEGNIDQGCDSDDDDYCDSGKLVNFSWLSVCGDDEGPGCCKKTWEDVSWNELNSHDSELFETEEMQRCWFDESGTQKFDTIHIARGDDCNDNDLNINPYAREKCYSEGDDDDNDCDDGTNAKPLYKHWDADSTTGVNEGCEDDNKADCERYGHTWIGDMTQEDSTLGSCCGNNTYQTTSGTSYGYMKPNEFFPYWNEQMEAEEDIYEYSGCWDSQPLRNNDTANTNLIIAAFPGAPQTTEGYDDFYLSTTSTVGTLSIPSDGMNVSESNNYIFHTNMSLEGDEGTMVRIQYHEKKNGEWENEKQDTGIIMSTGEDWKIKEYEYTPGNNVEAVKFLAYVIGEGTLDLRDTKFYKDEDKKVLNQNGAFYGCEIGGDSWMREQVNTYSTTNINNPVLAILGDDYVAIDDNPHNCTVKGGFFCSQAGAWKPNVDGIKTNNITSIPEEESVLEGAGYFKSFHMTEDCCPPDYCWDGASCQSGAPEFTGVHMKNISINDEERNYKCVKGEWQNASLKTSQDNTTTGYCGQYQCLYNPPESQPLCVNDGNYTFDDYCLKGTWTSRTNTIALQLIDIAEKDGIDDYTLFCDNYKNALNDYDYDDPEAGWVLEYIVGEKKGEEDGLGQLFDCGFDGWSGEPGEGRGCANNFCVLRYKDSSDNSQKTVFGTSLNFPINASDDDFRHFLSFLRLFDAKTRNIVPSSADHYTYCDGVLKQGSDRYLGCSGRDSYKEDEEWDLWYNTGTQSIIYAPQEVNPGEFNLLESFTDFLKKPFTTVINYIKGIPQEKYKRYDYGFVEDAGKFRKLYINSKFDGTDRKQIRGFVEKIGAETAMIIDYDMVGTNICRKIDDYNKKYSDNCMYGPMYCPMNCEPKIDSEDSWSFHVESTDEEGISLWPDLTAKLRMDDEVRETESLDYSDDVEIYMDR
ncbi:MAG: putative metal-binding motif-containing protein [Candidatus Woesearchaeota archaeon]